MRVLALIFTVAMVEAILSDTFSRNSISYCSNTLKAAISSTPSMFSSCLSGTITMQLGLASPNPDVMDTKLSGISVRKIVSRSMAQAPTRPSPSITCMLRNFLRSQA